MKVYVDGVENLGMMKPLQSTSALEMLLGQYFKCVVITRQAGDIRVDFYTIEPVVAHRIE